MKYWSSSIGKKQLMALCGAGLSLFVMTHMLGNLLIFVGPEAYNKYGHALVSNPLIYVAEAGLVFMFVAHAVLGIMVSRENRLARGDRHYDTTSGKKAVSTASKTMIFQGLLLLAFTISHLATFKYGKYYEVTYDGETIRNLHKLVIQVFREPAYVLWYLVSLISLALHLSHGVWSAFQTFGVFHPRYTPLIRCASVVYALVVTIGFLSAPIYIFIAQPDCCH